MAQPSVVTEISMALDMDLFKVGWLIRCACVFNVLQDSYTQLASCIHSYWELNLSEIWQVIDTDIFVKSYFENLMAAEIDI